MLGDIFPSRADFRYTFSPILCGVNKIIKVRPILWYDYPFIFRHRRQLHSLDNIKSLTRGTPFSLTNLLSSLLPSEHEFTGVYESEKSNTKIIGQIHQSIKLETTHLSYLLQPPESEPGDLVFLLEGLIKRAGKWGAKQLVAEIPLTYELFTHFRKAGFSVLAKQQIYRWNGVQKAPKSAIGGSWRIWNCEDVSSMRSLYLTLVPPLIQPIEPLTRRERLGLVHIDAHGNLQAYADAIAAYEEAIRIKPSGKEALANMEQAKTLKTNREREIARQETFDNAIRNGDMLFEEKSYEEIAETQIRIGTYSRDSPTCHRETLFHRGAPPQTIHRQTPP